MIETCAMVSKIRPFWTEIRENGLAATVLQVGYIPYKVKELKVEIAVAVYKITKEIQPNSLVRSMKQGSYQNSSTSEMYIKDYKGYVGRSL